MTRYDIALGKTVPKKSQESVINTYATTTLASGTVGSSFEDFKRLLNEQKIKLEPEPIYRFPEFPTGSWDYNRMIG